MRITCPHCGQPGKIRTSRAVTCLTREAYVQCQNIECCHVWKVVIGAVTTIVQSLIPNPAVYIRVSNKPQAANDRQLSLLEK